MNKDTQKSDTSALPYETTDGQQGRSLVDYLQLHLVLIYRYRATFIKVCVFVLVLGVLYAFFYPATYKSYARIISITPPAPLGALSMIGGGEEGVDKLAALGLATGGKEAKLLTILGSATIAEAVFKNSGLIEYFWPEQWNEETGTWEDPNDPVPSENLIVEFQKCFSANLDNELNFIKLSVTLPKPELAHRVLNQVLVELQNILNNKSFSLAGKNRKFIEQRIGETKLEIERTATELKTFQEQHNLYDVSAQLSKVVELSAKMEADKVEREISKELLLKYSTQANPKVVLLQQEIDELTAMLNKLAKGETGNPPEDGSTSTEKASLLPTLDEVLELANEFSKLKTTYETQLQLLSLLIMQYEVAKVEEANDSLNFQVIDEPSLPYYKDWPVKKVVAFVGGLLALVIAWISVLYKHYKSWMRKRLYCLIEAAEPGDAAGKETPQPRKKKYNLTGWLKRKLADPEKKHN